MAKMLPSEFIVKRGAAMQDEENGKWVVDIEPKEEIVRCRDCTGMVETWDGYECERFSGEYHYCEPDGFCSWGKRK